MKTIKIGTATLIHGDCEEFMKDLQDKLFSLACVDPPYGIGIGSVGKMTSVSKKEYEIKDWDKNIPTQSYFDELKRSSLNQIIWGSNFFDGFGLSGGGIVWNKLGTHIGRRLPMPNLSDCEIAYCSMRSNVKMFSYTQIGNVYGNDYQIDWNQERIHPTQKPVKLYEWIYANYAKPGQTILDTHGGSMSSVIAALNMGFEITCIEKDEDYFNSAVERVIKSQQQQKLF